MLPSQKPIFASQLLNVNSTVNKLFKGFFTILYKIKELRIFGVLKMCDFKITSVPLKKYKTKKKTFTT